ncbi:MAG TPA: MMPL family transporter, partial [Roseiflexaceae bacterium]
MTRTRDRPGRPGNWTAGSAAPRTWCCACTPAPAPSTTRLSPGSATTRRRCWLRSRESHVESYWQTHNPALRSTDGRYALVVGSQRSDTTISASKLAPLRLRTPQADVSIGGDSAVSDDVSNNVGKSLALAEGIAVPIVMLLLVFAFGSLVSALLPLAIGAFAIMGTFAELSILGSVTDVAIYAVNLTTALGMALGIDYALLMVNRFREELGRGATTELAVRRAVSTAGRTIVFSGSTVIAALAALLIFPLYFLRSFAYAGIGVVVIAAVAALFVLPAL